MVWFMCEVCVGVMVGVSGEREGVGVCGYVWSVWCESVERGRVWVCVECVGESVERGRVYDCESGGLGQSGGEESML